MFSTVMSVSKLHFGSPGWVAAPFRWTLAHIWLIRAPFWRKVAPFWKVSAIQSFGSIAFSLGATLVGCRGMIAEYKNYRLVAEVSRHEALAIIVGQDTTRNRFRHLIGF